METPVLEFSDVNYIYHTISCETVALKDISFKLGRNEFISFVGPSGCGKTTLLNLIAGLIPVSSGTIKLTGKELSGSSLNIGYMLQKDHLLEWRSIYKNLTLGLEIQGKKDAEHLAIIDDLLKTYGLDEFRNAFPRQLSGGMSQRASIARALIRQPDILLLDEPLGALDALTRYSMQEELEKIWLNNNTTMIMITHDIEEAVYLSDRIVVLDVRPCKVREIFTIPLEHPRNRNSKAFEEYRTCVVSSFRSAVANYSI